MPQQIVKNRAPRLENPVFTKNGSFNPKNDAAWADDRSDATEYVRLYSKEKYPVSVMVSLGATWYRLTSPYFFQQRQYLNDQTYRDKLLPFFQKEGNEFFVRNNWRFQQDGATSHTNQRAQHWCKKNFKFFIPTDRWPPNSPELNPLDYSIWDNISKHIKYGNVKKFNDLCRELEKAIKKFFFHLVYCAML